MLSKFRTYQLAVQFYKQCEKTKLPRHLKDQILGASSSIALNLAEGSVKPTVKDRMKFYHIAFGSLRECQSIIELSSIENLNESADMLGAHLYRLCNPSP